MNQQIEKAIEYLKQAVLQAPLSIRVEEVVRDRIMLSFEFETEYSWQHDRQYKDFFFGTDGEVISMLNYKR